MSMQPSLEIRCRIPHGYKYSCCALALTADGTKLLSGSEDGSIRLWELYPQAGESHLRLKLQTSNDSQVQYLALSSDGSRALSVSGSDLQIWDIETGKYLQKHQPVFSILCNLDHTPTLSRVVAHGKDYGTVGLWDLEKNLCLYSALKGHTQPVRRVAISPSGSLALSACSEPAVGHVLGRTADGKRYCKTIINDHPPDPGIRVWEVSSGQCLRTLEGHALGVGAIRIAGDNRTAVSAGEEGEVRVWDLHTGACRLLLPGHDRALTHIELSRDGRYAVSSGHDFTARIWDLTDGTCRCVLRPKRDSSGIGALNLLGITPDGQFLATNSGSSLWLWSMETGKCIAEWQMPTGSGFYAVVTNEYIAVAPIVGPDILLLALP